MMHETKESFLLGVSDGRHEDDWSGKDQRPSVTLLSRIKQKTACIGVIGLGYVGLPLVRAFVDKGFAVLGFDTDANKVERLQNGVSYIGHISDAIIREMRERKFEPTGDFLRLEEADAVIICVPTPLTSARTGPHLCDQVIPGDRRPPASRAARDSREHDLSWYHA